MYHQLNMSGENIVADGVIDASLHQEMRITGSFSGSASRTIVFGLEIMRYNRYGCGKIEIE